MVGICNSRFQDPGLESNLFCLICRYLLTWSVVRTHNICSIRTHLHEYLVRRLTIPTFPTSERIGSICDTHIIGIHCWTNYVDTRDKAARRYDFPAISFDILAQMHRLSATWQFRLKFARNLCKTHGLWDC